MCGIALRGARPGRRGPADHDCSRRGEDEAAELDPTVKTNVLGAQNGLPQAFFQNPFPQGLTPAYGKAYGPYTQLGDAVTVTATGAAPGRSSVAVNRRPAAGCTPNIVK